jgi:hypothetical protein
MKTKLKPCPFCGVDPVMEPYHGGGKLKRIIECVNDYCMVQPSVTGPNSLTAARRWNERAPVHETQT